MKEENIGVLSAGERFGFKGFEWIVLDNNVDGGVLAIMASAWNNEEYSFDDDGCNNYAKSSLRRKLLNELLPVLGEDNLIPHEVDMVADNGDDRYGTVTDRVFILSCDEYRKYRKHVPLLPEWVWAVRSEKFQRPRSAFRNAARRSEFICVTQSCRRRC